MVGRKANNGRERRDLSQLHRCQPLLIDQVTPILLPEGKAAAARPADRHRGRGFHFAKDQLKAFVERIERLEEEKKTIADDIRDVYAEAKGNGFDVKALRAS
jgi:hypothetical protein